MAWAQKEWLIWYLVQLIHWWVPAVLGGWGLSGELSLPKVGTHIPMAELRGAQRSVQQCEAIPGEAAFGLYSRPAECPTVSASLSASLGNKARLCCGGGTT